jgi:hypothetical protein
LYPTYYAKHGKRRVYLSVCGSNDKEDMRIGYINAISLKFVPETSWSLHIKEIKFDEFVEHHKQSLVNVARYGIEGCLIKHYASPPIGDFLQEMKSNLEIERELEKDSTVYSIRMKWEFLTDVRTLSYLLYGFFTPKLMEKGFHVSATTGTSFDCLIQAFADSADFMTVDEIRSVLLS